MCMSCYLLDKRDEDIGHFSEAVLLTAVQHISCTAQGGHLVHQALLGALLHHHRQHLRDGGLAWTGLLQLRATVIKTTTKKQCKQCIKCHYIMEDENALNK